MTGGGEYIRVYWEGHRSAANPDAINPYAGHQECEPEFRLAQIWQRGRQTAIEEQQNDNESDVAK